jgi:hypothetical protein
MIKSPPILNNPRKTNSNTTSPFPHPQKKRKPLMGACPSFLLAASKSYSLKPFVTNFF